MATVLVVDDHPEIATLHAIALRRAGHECLIAHDCAQAWAALGAQSVDLVLFDVMMPGETGPAFLRRMQCEPAFAALPVVFITARTDPATEIQCLAMGAVGFLTKPVSVRRLVIAVEAGLQRCAGGPREARDLLETAPGPDTKRARNGPSLADDDQEEQHHLESLVETRGRKGKSPRNSRLGASTYLLEAVHPGTGAREEGGGRRRGSSERDLQGDQRQAPSAGGQSS
jgi:DNA-binding response OmpR family regulator